jgi:hypothetical protein
MPKRGSEASVARPLRAQESGERHLVPRNDCASLRRGVRRCRAIDERGSELLVGGGRHLLVDSLPEAAEIVPGNTVMAASVAADMAPDAMASAATDIMALDSPVAVAADVAAGSPPRSPPDIATQVATDIATEVCCFGRCGFAT